MAAATYLETKKTEEEKQPQMPFDFLLPGELMTPVFDHLKGMGGMNHTKEEVFFTPFFFQAGHSKQSIG